MMSGTVQAQLLILMIVFCHVCRPYEQTGAFVVGCSVFKKASIVAHEKSKSH